MKKFLLAVAAFAAVSSVSAQETYNYFDADDVDANGWLWFDTQAKIDKYVGFQGMGQNPKIMLLSARYEDENYQYPEPYADPDVKGWNINGELGGDGAKTGAIVLCAGSSSLGSLDKPNGGGILMYLPDCAEFHMFLSTEGDRIVPALWGANKEWKEPIDCGVIKTYVNMGLFGSPLVKAPQYEWLNMQNLINTVDDVNRTLASPKGVKVTALIRNNINVPLYIHGIKVMTYTKASNSEAGIDDVLGGSALSLSFNGNAVNATEAADMSVYSVSGAKVAEAHGTTFALDNLAPGAYVVKAVSANGTATIKVVR